jgi:lysophospholipase L1-like esterase
MSGVGRKLAFSIVPVVVVGAAAELGLRSAGWPSVTQAFEHNTPFWVTDPDLKRKPFPHKEEQKVFAVSSNIDGLRGVSVAREKPEGAHRIMTLGCSTTFGWGVDDDSSYPAVLDSLIEDEQTHVINGGQPGYTSFQGRWLWNKTLKHYAPDVVLIGYVVQDARKAAYSDKSQAVLQGDHRYLKDNVLYNSRVYLGLRSMLGGIQVSAKERPQNGKGGVYRVPPPDFAENLRALVAGVQDVGAVPVLFGFPLEREGYTEQHRRILEAASAELGVPHLDLQSRMEQASRNARLYFERDRGHANAAGNAQIAEWVHEFLQAQGLLRSGA